MAMAARAPLARKGHEACSGCSLCLLACPVWHATRDIRLTPHGRAKALQHGAEPEDLAGSVDACTLCGTCEPACPEDMALVDMVLELRARLGREVPARLVADGDPVKEADGPPDAPVAAVRIVPDVRLAEQERRLQSIVALWPRGEATVVADHGGDIALALESGGDISDERVERFVAPLRGARQVVICDGLLFRRLAAWLPGVRRASLGEALSGVEAVASKLRPQDFYVIEPRAYHADRERLVRHYDALRRRTGCAMNLDLQRLAVPTTAGSLATTEGKSRVDVREQAKWILEGREFGRIVVEDVNDIEVFSAVTDVPVVHVSELPDA